jgi:hypothetical protein
VTTRTPHTYARRTITLPPDLDTQLLEKARRDHGGNVSAAVAELVRGSVTKSGTSVVSGDNAANST